MGAGEAGGAGAGRPAAGLAGPSLAAMADPLLRTLLTAAPVGFAVLDRELRFLVVNDALAQINGRPAADHLGRSLRDVVPGLADVAEPAFRRVLVTGEPLRELELSGTVASSPGVERVWLESVYRVPALDGRRPGLAVLVWEITDRRLLEQERDRLAAEQADTLALLDTLIAGAPIGFAFLDRDLRYLRINGRLADFNGVPVAEHLGRTVRDVLPELGPDIEPLLHRVLGSGQPIVDLEVETGPTPAAPGVRRRWLVSYYPVSDPRGGAPPLGVGLLVNDITERYAAEQAQVRGHAQLQLALDAARMGTWDWDLSAGTLRWSDQLERIFGLRPGTFGGDYSAFTALVHPEDLSGLTAAVRHAVDAAGTFEHQYRIVRPDGGVRWVLARGQVLLDPAGARVRMTGVALDVTEQRTAQQRLVQTFEHITDAFFALDRSWRFSYLNWQAERLLQRSREELLGRVLWEEFPEALGTVFEDSYRTAMRGEAPAAFEAFYAPLQLWVEVRASPTPDGLSVYFRDVTGRREEAERTRALHQLTAALAQAVTVAEVAAVVRDHACPAVGAHAGGVALLDEASGELRFVGVPPHPAGSPLRWCSVPVGADLPTAAAVRDGRPRFIPTVETFLARHPDAADLVAVTGDRAWAILPLIAGGGPRGVLALAYPSARAFEPDERSFLTALAGQCAEALERARLYEREHAVAEILQRSLLPTLPTVPGVALAARYLPASTGAEVGGDWYDAFVLPDGALALVIGDVVGHDLQAAGRMGQLRNLLRGLAWDRPELPADILHRLDGLTCGLAVADLATVLLARVDRVPGRAPLLRWATAGHPPPLLVNPDGIARLLDGEVGLVLGVDPDSRRRDTERPLPAGASLLLYTDGLVESRENQLDAGFARLRAAATGHRPGDGPDALCERVTEHLLGRRRRDDDAALLAVTLLPADVPVSA